MDTMDGPMPAGRPTTIPLVVAQYMAGEYCWYSRFQLYSWVGHSNWVFVVCMGLHSHTAERDGIHMETLEMGLVKDGLLVGPLQYCGWSRVFNILYVFSVYDWLFELLNCATNSGQWNAETSGRNCEYTVVHAR